MFHMSDVEHDLRSRVDSFVNELSALIRRQALEAVEEVLKKGETAAPARKPGRPAKVVEEPKARTAKPAPTAKAAPAKVSAAAKRKAGEKRTPAQLAAITEQVFNHIKGNPGQGVEQIAKALAHLDQGAHAPDPQAADGQEGRLEGPEAGDPLLPPLSVPSVSDSDWTTGAASPHRHNTPRLRQRSRRACRGRLSRHREVERGSRKGGEASLHPFGGPAFDVTSFGCSTAASSRGRPHNAHGLASRA